MNDILLPLCLIAAVSSAEATPAYDAMIIQLEAECSGWSGEDAYRRAHDSGDCLKHLGIEEGERSAHDAPPAYRMPQQPQRQQPPAQ